MGKQKTRTIREDHPSSLFLSFDKRTCNRLSSHSIRAIGWGVNEHEGRFCTSDAILEGDVLVRSSGMRVGRMILRCAQNDKGRGVACVRRGGQAK